MVQSYFDGDTSTATKIQLESIPLINSLFSEVNPIPVKAALNLMGYQYGVPRLPLVEMTEAGKENLRKELNAYGIETKN